MANSAAVDGKEEIAVKSLAHNEKQTQETPELIKDQNQTAQFDEKVLLLEIQRQLAERDQYLRAKDIQLQELEERLQMYVQSGSYRLGRTLTGPVRLIKKLLGNRRSS